jgi:outer membrane immunogenic protein
MIRGIVLGAASAVAIVASANAADLYRPSASGGLKDPVYAPAATWTGLYLGVNGGYGWSADSNKLAASANKYTPCYSSEGEGDGEGGIVLYSQCLSTVDSDASAKSFSTEGGFGGGQIGYNLQRDRLVFGAEFDIQGAAISGDARFALLGGLAGASASSELNWFGALTGRVGYAFDNTLLYFKGGLAFGGVKDSVTVAPVEDPASTVTKDETRTGYVLGGGIEHKLTPSVSVKAEYQYIDLGSDRITTTAGYAPYNDASATLDARHTYHTARVGLNYHVGQGYEPLK